MTTITSIAGVQAIRDASQGAQKITHSLADFASGKADEFHPPSKLSDSEHQAGLHLNQVTIHLTGNNHFPGWWEVVPFDTEFVVAQGAAYKGQSVNIGYETVQDAAIIYAKRLAGMDNRVPLKVAGQAGERVRLLYVRGAKGTNAQLNGTSAKIVTTGQSALIGGDRARRDVQFAIQKTNSPTALPVSGGVTQHLDDPYGWSSKGQTLFQLGGSASEYHLREAMAALSRGEKPKIGSMYPSGR